jgi:hypothetical protein
MPPSGYLDHGFNAVIESFDVMVWSGRPMAWFGRVGYTPPFEQSGVSGTPHFRPAKSNGFPCNYFSVPKGRKKAGDEQCYRQPGLLGNPYFQLVDDRNLGLSRQSQAGFRQKNATLVRKSSKEIQNHAAISIDAYG